MCNLYILYIHYIAKPSQAPCTFPDSSSDLNRRFPNCLIENKSKWVKGENQQTKNKNVCIPIYNIEYLNWKWTFKTAVKIALSQ